MGNAINTLFIDFRGKAKGLKTLPLVKKNANGLLRMPEKDSFEVSFRGWSSDNDQDWQTIKDLASQLKFSRTKQNRRKLWEQERKVLEQELKNPEKYLERVKKTGGMEEVPEGHEAQLNQVRINSLKGLITYVIPLRDMNEERFTDPNFYYPLFEGFIKDVPQHAPLAEELKTWTLHLSSAMYDDADSANKKKAEDIALHVIKTSPFDQCKTIALNLFADHVDKEKPCVRELQKYFYKQWQAENTSKEQKYMTLTALGKLEAPELKKIIPEILNNREAIKDRKLETITVWSAGRAKSPENFKLLVRTIKSCIANDPELEDGDNLRVAEMALHSVLEYDEKSSDSVRKLLKQLAKPRSPLEITATAMLEKVERKCKLPEFYLKKEIKSSDEQEEYRKYRENYVDGMELLDTEQMNWLDRGLLPFRKFLDFFKFVDSKLSISDDTSTGVDKGLTGKRTGDGRFWDMITGSGGDKQAVVTVCDFKKPFRSRSHIAGHEMSHQVLKHLKKFDRDEYNELERLFENAKKEDKCLDAYSASDIEEFWAVGYETYLLHYKPHKDLIDFDEKEVGTANTRSVLMRKDRDFYDFIEHIIDKYGKSEVGVQRAKKGYRESKNRVIHIPITAG